jgi:hypothetical protein
LGGTDQYAEAAGPELTVYETFVEGIRIAVELAVNNTKRRRVLVLLVREGGVGWESTSEDKGGFRMVRRRVKKVISRFCCHVSR